jgi:hypothetical protein
VTDDDLVQSVQPVIITIHGTDDAPLITSGSTASVTEAVSANTVVYTEIASDPDGDTLTYSLVAGGDASAFSVNSSTGVVTINNAPDFETRSSYSFTPRDCSTRRSSRSSSTTSRR